MGVRKFRSIEEMGQPVWRTPGDPALAQAIAATWAFGAAVVGLRFPPGVYRHRTIESLDARTEAWAQENFRAFHAARTPDPPR